MACGTGPVDRASASGPAVETDDAFSSSEFPRAATEEAAGALVAKGGRVILMRLSQVHDTRHQGRIAEHIKLARQQGWVAYVGEGKNPFVGGARRRCCAAFPAGAREGPGRRALSRRRRGGVAMRDIAEVIGAGLKLPVKSISTEQTALFRLDRGTRVHLISRRPAR